MNKKLKELQSQIEAKLAEAKAVKDTDIEKANGLMSEVAQLKEKYDLEKALAEAEKDLVAKMADEEAAKAVTPEAEEKEISTDELVAKQVKALLRPMQYASDKNLSDTVSEDGGYTVPVDAIYTINKYKEAYANLASEITTESVSTRTGTRVFQKRGTPGAFAKLNANGMGYKASASDTEANLLANPKFEQLAYAIEDYAGFMPVPNNLINDSDANITSLVYEWLGKAAADTDNAEILGLLGQTGTNAMDTGWTDLVNLDGIKKAVNITLGQAFAPTAKIYTNDDGAQYLAELKEKADSNVPLLTPVITDPAKTQLSVGFRSVPVVILPNEVLKSIDATASAGGKIPMIIGDLKEAIVKFDRQNLEIAASNVATIGDSNAFAKNMTLFRGILRADYTIRDAAAVVKGYIGTPKKTA